MRSPVQVFAAAGLLMVALAACPAGAEEPKAAAAEAKAPAVQGAHIEGKWTGAKLRCQKEENKLVRCGTPTPFEITFVASGTGTTPDENLPAEFTWRWTSDKEIVMTPKAGGKEIKLFGVEHEDERILTFQAYIYLPAADPNAPVEVRYIHYIFDVNRSE